VPKCYSYSIIKLQKEGREKSFARIHEQAAAAAVRMKQCDEADIKLTNKKLKFHLLFIFFSSRSLFAQYIERKKKWQTNFIQFNSSFPSFVFRTRSPSFEII
jgi:hypothetical protein